VIAATNFKCICWFYLIPYAERNTLFCLPAAITCFENQAKFCIPNQCSTSKPDKNTAVTFSRLSSHISLYQKQPQNVDTFVFLKFLNHSPILCFAFLEVRNVRNGTLRALNKMYLYNYESCHRVSVTVARDCTLHGIYKMTMLIRTFFCY